MKRNRNLIRTALAVFGIFLAVPLFPQITVLTQDVSCHGCTDGSASVTVEGGTPPYEYIWPDGGGGPVKTNLAAGYYVVVIVDANGCSGSKSIYIHEPPDLPDPFTIEIVAPKDPNDITGPAGYGDPRWVSVNDELNYMIRFENDPEEATAPVQKVVITHPIDDMANMFSFKLGDFSFRNFTFQVPQNTSHYFKRLDLSDSIGVILNVTAGLDVTKNQAFWIFQAFDPATGLPNLNPEVGFLLVNDSITHGGEGSVNFFIKPKSSANTGDIIEAYASIVFDFNEPLETNTEQNMIDAFAPVSRIKSINRISSDIAEIAWSGSDDPNGSGVAGYKLLIGTGQDPYRSYANIRDTSFVVDLAGGNEFRIQSVAKDHTNNTEMIKSLPDTVLFIRPVVALGKDISICANDSVILNAGSGFDTYLWNDGSTSRTLVVKSPGRYFVTAQNDSITSSDTIVIGRYDDPVPVLHTNNPVLCAGGSLTLDAGDGYRSYLWNTRDTTRTIQTVQPGQYTVAVVDQHGCPGTDALSVTLHEKPVFTLGNDVSILTSETVILVPQPNNFASYLWNDNSTNDTLVLTGSLAGAGEHAIGVTVTDLYGCSASDAILVTVSVPIGVEEETLNGMTLTLSPVPVIDRLRLTIEGEVTSDLLLEIFNADGAMILVRPYRQTGTVISDEFDMSGYAPGPYIFRVISKDGEMVRTVVKK